MRNVTGAVCASLVLLCSCVAGTGAAGRAGALPAGYTNVCTTSVTNTWAYRYNRLIVEPSSTRHPHMASEVTYNGPSQECTNQSMGTNLIEGEAALTRTGDMRVIGDLCAAEPQLVIERVRINAPLTPKNIAYQKTNRNSPYDFYVDSRTQLVGSIRRVDDMLEAFKVLVSQQCGAVPPRVRVFGRTKYNQPNSWVRKPGDKRWSHPGNPPVEYTTFYSGTYYPDREPFALEHDDTEQAVLYKVLEGEFRRHIAQQYRYDPNRAALGLGVIALWALAAQDGGDPNGLNPVDPLCYSGLSAGERIAYGCPF